MKDIRKHNKIVTEKVMRINTLFSTAKAETVTEKNFLSKFMMTAMLGSIFVYLFFVTSSIFYAINIQSYAYEIDELSVVALDIGYGNINQNFETVEKPFSQNNKKEKITFINRNANTTISLK